MKNIVWLASYPKSGNTWLRTIIYTALNNELKLNDIGNFIPNFSFYADLEAQNKIQNFSDVRKFWYVTQLNLSKKANKHILLLKTHNITGKYDVGFFPSKEFTKSAIYVVRDPRDVAISYSKHFDHDLITSTNVLMDDKNYNVSPNFTRAEFISSWNLHVESWLKTSFPVLVLKYEDLIQFPENSIEKILNFLRIETNITIPQIIEKTSFRQLSRLENKLGFFESNKKNKFFRKGEMNQWKKQNFNFDKMINKFSTTMKKLNYI